MISSDTAIKGSAIQHWRIYVSGRGRFQHLPPSEQENLPSCPAVELVVEWVTAIFLSEGLQGFYL